MASPASGDIEAQTQQGVATGSAPDAGGYPKLSAFVNSSPGHIFQLFRRFGVLNARVLLHLQDELCELESALAELDASPHDSGTRRYDQNPDRPLLIQTITTKVAEYNNLLLSISGMLALQRASSYQYENFRRWFDYRNPLVQEEVDFLRDPHDLVALGGPERDWLHRKIEGINSRLFTDKAYLGSQQLAEDNQYLVFSSQSRLQRTVRLFVVFFGLLSLLSPILALFYVKHKESRLGIVCSAIVIFALVVASFAPARNVEILAAVAAYSAVVVVFLGAI
ncbi:MAG: hypothetical protein M1839_006455 [Geoglossum umbratile]|nr:MAG: hypothetical protein M1839_006455 [Geoglossum umbratile]